MYSITVAAKFTVLSYYRGTDRQTDGSRHRLMPPVVGREHSVDAGPADRDLRGPRVVFIHSFVHSFIY